MNKSQLIEAVASDSGLSKTDSARAIESLIDTVTRTLKKGDEVSITGFGKFSVKDTAPSVRVNPQTREKINVPARKRVKFSPGKELSDAVEGAKAEEAKAAAPKATAPASKATKK